MEYGVGDEVSVKTFHEGEIKWIRGHVKFIEDDMVHVTAFEWNFKPRTVFGESENISLEYKFTPVGTHIQISGVSKESIYYGRKGIVTGVTSNYDKYEICLAQMEGNFPSLYNSKCSLVLPRSAFIRVGEEIIETVYEDSAVQIWMSEKM